MNVLGVVFNSKLNWQIHISNAISKAKKSFYALRLVKKYFNETQMRTLIDSNFTLSFIIFILIYLDR